MSANKPVVIFGTTDLARVAHFYLTHDSPFEVAAFTVDSAYIDQDQLLGVPVVPFEQVVTSHPPDAYDMFVGVGFKRANRVRTEIYERGKALGYRMITYINSRAITWGEIAVGDNCFILEANVIQPFVTIGNNVVIWSGNHIGHDSKIGDNCFIASHVVISGNVTIGPFCFVGVNATFRDGVKVAPRCVIGAGAIIMKDTEEGDVYSVRGTEPIEAKSWELKNF
jgi:sugar O-acyltransferase (sialic acid O-acetyltransferase NeuD family)